MEDIKSFLRENFFFLEDNTDNNARTIAFLSAFIGIFILFMGIIAPQEGNTRFGIAFTGFYYLFIAAALNGLYLLYMIFRVLFITKFKRSNLISIFIMLCNIPLAVICAVLGIQLVG